MPLWWELANNNTVHLRHDFFVAPSDIPLDLIKRLKYLKPAFELRERWSYNNIVNSFEIWRILG